MKIQTPILTVVNGLPTLIPEPVAAHDKFTVAFATRVALNRDGPEFVDYGFKGNCSGAVDARRRLCEGLSLPFENLTVSRQVHGARVTTVGEELAGRGRDAPDGGIPENDGMITNEPGVALAIMTADCVPVMIADAQSGAVGAAHAGWRGLLAGIVGNVVRAFTGQFGADTKNVMAFIGPSIGPCCFEIQKDVVDGLTGSERDFLSNKDKGIFLDPWRLAASKLIEAGIDPENIWSADLCTRCHVELFHSYRGDKSRRGSNISIIARSV